MDCMKQGYPHGVRFWAQHYENVGARKFEVFEFIRAHKGELHFLSISNNCIIRKKRHQLNQGGFYPFCLVTERLLPEAA